MSEVDEARDEIIDAIDEAVNKLGKDGGLELLNLLFDDIPMRINEFDPYYGKLRKPKKRAEPMTGVTKLAPVTLTVGNPRRRRGDSAVTKKQLKQLNKALFGGKKR